MDKALDIGGRRFEFVKDRLYTPISIYKGNNCFLRIGEPEILLREIALHREFLDYGFPLPSILEEGKFEDRFYYLESSLGEKHFGDLFHEDVIRKGEIAEETFKEFMQMAASFAAAQAKSASGRPSREIFARFIHLNNLQEERPDLSGLMEKALNKMWPRLGELPAVLTHGDFNAFNQFPAGVIDLDAERTFWGPAGYDLATVLAHTRFFPVEGDLEKLRWYDFSPAQEKEYLEMADKIYSAHGIPAPSGFYEEFRLCRGVFAVVRMLKDPKLAAWRYRFFEELLQDYLSR